MTSMQGVFFLANSMTLFNACSLSPSHFDLMSALRIITKLYSNFLHKALHIMDLPTPAGPLDLQISLIKSYSNKNLCNVKKTYHKTLQFLLCESKIHPNIHFGVGVLLSLSLKMQ